MKYQSMIFTYWKNIKKQWVLESMDLTLYFLWTNLKKTTILLSPELINSVGGFEEISIRSKEIFKVTHEKLVKTAIDRYIKKLTVNFINESCFLYDKSNFIKETFITEINKKKILMYGSISYFVKKQKIKYFRKLSKVFCRKRQYKN